MYGLPRDLDLSFFLEKTLLQVCVGANELILNFHDRVSITVMSSIGLALSNGVHRKYESFPEAAGIVVGLLDQTIASATAGDDGTLSLQFHGGGQVDIYDDSKQYESYTITSGDRLFVI